MFFKCSTCIKEKEFLNLIEKQAPLLSPQTNKINPVSKILLIIFIILGLFVSAVKFFNWQLFMGPAFLIGKVTS